MYKRLTSDSCRSNVSTGLLLYISALYFTVLLSIDGALIKLFEFVLGLIAFRCCLSLFPLKQRKEKCKPGNLNDQRILAESVSFSNLNIGLLFVSIQYILCAYVLLLIKYGGSSFL